jgi:hypothetical protein
MGLGEHPLGGIDVSEAGVRVGGANGAQRAGVSVGTCRLQAVLRETDRP